MNGVAQTKRVSVPIGSQLIGTAQMKRARLRHGSHCSHGNWNRSLKTVEEDQGDISEEVHQDEDGLHAWCLLEKSEALSLFLSPAL